MTKIVLKKYIRADIRQRNKHRFIAMGYAVAIMFAFLITLSNNNESNALISKDDSLGYLLLDTISDNSFIPESSLYPQEPIENIKSLLEIVQPLGPQQVEKEIEVQKGDTLISLLQNIGLSNEKANDVYALIKKEFDPRNLKAGEKLSLSLTISPEDNRLISMDSLSFEPKTGTRLIVSLNDSGNFTIKKEVDELVLEVNSAFGSINGIVSKSLQAAGVSSQMTHEFIKIFSTSVDFRRDVRKGDKFEIIYENYISPKGQVVKTGNVLYASLQLRKNKIALYRFKDKAGNVDYYSEKGLAYSKKTLHRKPLAFQNARISSPFGRRRHPIYRDIRIHWGVDYAAPRGTAVYAAGDGVIKEIKYNGGYGKFIKIRHNSEYSTAYGHLNGYAKGLKAGSKVKQGQIIAYVGSTGRSTGPHLHYEVIQAGRRVNPTTIKAASGENLKGDNLKKFQTSIAVIKATHNKMFAQN